MRMTRIAIDNPVFATMVMVAICVLGMFSYARLPVEQMPEVNLPFLIIQTGYPGASPEQIEKQLIPFSWLRAPRALCSCPVSQLAISAVIWSVSLSSSTQWPRSG